MDDKNLLDIFTTLRDSDSNRTRFDESWTQGRSAYGGLSAALAVVAMRKLLTAPQPLRSLMVSFIAPIAAGEVEVLADIQRQGKNVSQIKADVLADDGAVALQAMAVFGNPRKALQLPAARAELPPIAGLSFDAKPQRLLPPFLQYFDGYWQDGAIPFSGRTERKLALWLRHKSPLVGFPDERIVAMADMPPPVVLSHFTTPVPASSVSWSVEFVVPPEQVESEWLYLEFVAEAAADGYTQQSGALYDESGRLCVLSRQCMVYFG